jgi:hypothetical protein
MLETTNSINTLLCADARKSAAKKFEKNPRIESIE